MGNIGAFKNDRFRNQLTQAWGMNCSTRLADNSIGALLVRQKHDEIGPAHHGR